MKCRWVLQDTCPNFILVIEEANIQDIVWPSCHRVWDMEGCTRVYCVTLPAVRFCHLGSYWATKKDCVGKDTTLWQHTSWRSILLEIETSSTSLSTFSLAIISQWSFIHKNRFFSHAYYCLHLIRIFQINGCALWFRYIPFLKANKTLTKSDIMTTFWLSWRPVTAFRMPIASAAETLEFSFSLNISRALLVWSRKTPPHPFRDRRVCNIRVTYRQNNFFQLSHY